MTLQGYLGRGSVAAPRERWQGMARYSEHSPVLVVRRPRHRGAVDPASSERWPTDGLYGLSDSLFEVRGLWISGYVLVIERVSRGRSVSGKRWARVSVALFRRPRPGQAPLSWEAMEASGSPRHRASGYSWCCTSPFGAHASDCLGEQPARPDYFLAGP